MNIRSMDKTDMKPEVNLIKLWHVTSIAIVVKLYKK